MTDFFWYSINEFLYPLEYCICMAFYCMGVSALGFAWLVRIYTCVMYM